MATGMVINVPDDDGDLQVDPSEASGRQPKKDGERRNDAGFTDLKAQLDQANQRTAAERTRADNAEARARQSAGEVEAAKTEVAATRKVSIDNALTAAETAMAALESDLAAAFEAGDSKKHAATQRRMAELGGEIAQLRAGKAAIAAEPEPGKGRAQETADPSARRTKPLTEDEQFEDHLSKQGYSDTVKEWIRKHPEVVKSETKRNEAMSAHHAILAAGYKAESPEYFAQLDRRMGYRGSRAAEDIARDNPIEDEPRREPMRSAPARGSSGGSGGGAATRQIELSPGEVANATDGTIVWNAGEKDRRGKVIPKDDPRVGEPIGVEEMARRKRDYTREGRYAVPTL